MTKNLKIAMLGFGNAGRAFAKLLIDKQDEIINKYNCNIQVVAIATRNKGPIAWAYETLQFCKVTEVNGILNSTTKK